MQRGRVRDGARRGAMRIRARAPRKRVCVRRRRVCARGVSARDASSHPRRGACASPDGSALGAGAWSSLVSPLAGGLRRFLSFAFASLNGFCCAALRQAAHLRASLRAPLCLVQPDGSFLATKPRFGTNRSDFPLHPADARASRQENARSQVSLLRRTLASRARTRFRGQKSRILRHERPQAIAATRRIRRVACSALHLPCGGESVRGKGGKERQSRESALSALLPGRGLARTLPAFHALAFRVLPRTLHVRVRVLSHLTQEGPRR